MRKPGDLLFSASELHEELEVRVGGFDFNRVMPCTGGDKNVGSRRSFAAFPASARKFACFFPDLVVDWDFWQHLFIGAQGRAFLFVSHSGPKFEPNRRAPRRLTRFQEQFNLCPDSGIALRAELFDPG